MPDDFDSFMQSRQPAPPPPADDFDSFMQSRQAQPPAAQNSGLPHPSDAVAQAEAEARRQAGILSDVGNQMHQSVLSKINDSMVPQVTQPSHPYGGAPLLPSRPVSDSLVDLPGRGVIKAVDGVEQMAEPDLQDKTRGAGKVFTGGLQALSPAAIPTAVTAPAEMGAYVMLSHGLGGLGQNLGKQAGMNDEDAALTGDVAGALPMVYGGIKEGAKGFADQRAQTKADIEQHWQDLGDKLEPARTVAPGAAEPFPVKVATSSGTVDAQVEVKGTTPAGEPFRQVIQKETGKVLYGGDDKMVSEWLQQRAVEDNGWLTKLSRSKRDSDGSAGQNVAPVIDKLKQQEILADSGTSNAPTGQFKVGDRVIVGQNSGLAPATVSKLHGSDYTRVQSFDGSEQLLPSDQVRVPEDGEFEKAHQQIANTLKGQIGQLQSALGQAREYNAPKKKIADLKTQLQAARDQFSAVSQKLNDLAAEPKAVALKPPPAPRPNDEEMNTELPPRAPVTPPAVGKPVNVEVPGESTTYPARYAIREAADVQPSHNPQTFEKNPSYDYENDRDYSTDENKGRVVDYSAKGNFKPNRALTPSDTAEQGAPILDQRGNVLGGNNRSMTIQRVYAGNPQGATDYRQKLKDEALTYGIDPAEVGRFKDPVLVRELTGTPTRRMAQQAITDFNKTASAKLSPEEQAVADGRRLSQSTISEIGANLGEVGEDSMLAQALRGEKGTDIIHGLVSDGVITAQERNGYIDDRGQLTGTAKDRIAKALVGRLFDTPSDLREAPQDVRNKLERIAPQLLRVEGRRDWDLVQPVREALGAIADARAHGLKSLDDLGNQQSLAGTSGRKYSPEVLAIAKKLQESPTSAQRAFRQYATDADLSKDGSQVHIFEPPTRAEAFETAFGVKPEQKEESDDDRTSISVDGVGSARRQGEEEQRTKEDGEAGGSGKSTESKSAEEQRPAEEQRNEPARQADAGGSASDAQADEVKPPKKGDGAKSDARIFDEALAAALKHPRLGSQPDLVREDVQREFRLSPTTAKAVMENAVQIYNEPAFSQKDHDAEHHSDDEPDQDNEREEESLEGEDYEGDDYHKFVSREEPDDEFDEFMEQRHLDQLNKVGEAAKPKAEAKEKFAKPDKQARKEAVERAGSERQELAAKSRTFASQILAHARWEKVYRNLLADPKASRKSLAVAEQMVDRFAEPLVSQLPHHALTAGDIREDFEENLPSEKPARVETKPAKSETPEAVPEAKAKVASEPPERPRPPEISFSELSKYKSSSPEAIQKPEPEPEPKDIPLPAKSGLKPEHQTMLLGRAMDTLREELDELEPKAGEAGTAVHLRVALLPATTFQKQLVNADTEVRKQMAAEIERGENLLKQDSKPAVDTAAKQESKKERKQEEVARQDAKTSSKQTAEEEVRRILGRRGVSDLSLPDYFGSSDHYSFAELNAALVKMLHAGLAQRVAMPDGGFGFKLIPNRKETTGAEQPDSQTVKQPEAPAAESVLHPKMRELVNALDEAIERRIPIKNTSELVRIAQSVTGDKLTDGKYDLKDLYDALETAVNQVILRGGFGNALRSNDAEIRHHAITELMEMTGRLPTQTVRTQEQKDFQQFSTPPALAFVAAWVAGIKPGEIVAEPSAGTGSLATFAKAAGGQVETNELAPGRREFLKMLGYQPSGFNAEHIRDFRPELQPDVVLMNPPFSSTAGRLDKNSNAVGFQHVLSALDTLPEGGRLVAILGRGASFDHPTAAPLWTGIAKRGASVRANIGLSGALYKKYGTHFDNRLIVVDKAPVEAAPVVGDFDDLGKASDVLSAITQSRPAVLRSGEQVRPADAVRPTGNSGGQVSGEPVQPTAGGDGRGRAGSTRPEPGRSADDAQEQEAGSDHLPALPAGAESGSDEGRGRQPAEADTGSDQSAGRLRLRLGPPPKNKLSETGTYQDYEPAQLRTGVSHGKATGTELVETGAMAAVEPPAITYSPALPEKVIESGKVTNAQLESIVYAGQAHEEVMPSGSRAGFMIGDGTGVGKGTEAAGIALDNWNQGRRKILWLSLKPGLIKQAQRDLDWVGAPIKARPLNDWDYADPIQHEGVVFATYNTLHRQSAKGQGSRLDQIEKWKPDVILMDESHSAKNASGNPEKDEDEESTEDEGGIFGGGPQASKAGNAVLDLDKRLPDSRIVYMSATGFTDTRNLAYAGRLGLWGPGTPFKNFQDFNVQIDRGGLPAMELVAKELKANGRYLARQISFKGVDYSEREAKLTAAQRGMYDAAAEAWQSILQNIDKAIEAITGGPAAENSRSKGAAKARAMSQFWSTNQRFYRSLISAMKIPAVIEEIEKALEADKSVFIDLVSTGEAEQTRQLQKAATSNTALEDLDMSAKQAILNFLQQSFPVEMMEDFKDPEAGAVRSRPILDPNGKPLLNQEALALREEMMRKLDKIQMPLSPLDQIIDYFGADKVAEVSGRASRLVTDTKTGRTVEQTRVKPKGAAAKDVNDWERQQFMDGKKRIAIASGAGGTGFDFHADKRGKNQQRRVHIILEPSWSADTQMQKLGRTHRTNQALPPEYVLVASDLGGEKRFISAIASRMASLGALTRGERKAGGGAAEMLAKYNVEGKYGQAATAAWFATVDGTAHSWIQDDVAVKLPQPAQELKDGSRKVLKMMGALKETKDGEKVDDKMPVRQFLNRVLNLPTAIQRQAFDHFMALFDGIVKGVKDEGKFDEGSTELKAENPRVVGREQFQVSGAKTPTTHLTVEADFPVVKNHWEDAYSHMKFGDKDSMISRDLIGIWQNKRTGKLFAARRAGSDYTDPKTGAVTPMANLMSAERGKGQSVPAAKMSDLFTKVPADKAKEVWTKFVDALPEKRAEQVHLMTGSVLPIWRQLAAANGDSWRMKVSSIRDKQGRSMTGIQIPAEQINALRESLSGEGDYSPAMVMQRAQQGEKIALRGGSLAVGRVMHNPALVIQAGTKAGRSKLSELGIPHYETAGGVKHYLPLPEDAAQTESLAKLKRVLEAMPPVAATPAAAGNEPAAERRRPDRTPAKAEKPTAAKPAAAMTPMEMARVLGRDQEAHGLGDWLTSRLHSGAAEDYKGDMPTWMQYVIWGEEGLRSSDYASYATAKELETVREAGRKEAARLGLPMARGIAAYFNIHIPDAQGELPRESYRLRQPDSYHERRSAIQPIELPAEDARYANAYAVNPHAMEAVVRATGHELPQDTGALRIGGIHFSPYDSRLIASLLERQRIGRPGGTEPLEQAARRSAAESKSLVLVRTNSGQRDLPEEQITLREELNHALQIAASGQHNNQNHLGEKAREFLATRLGATAGARLLKSGYRLNQDQRLGKLAAEVGVRLMEPGREAELGLSAKEANALRRSYVKHLEEIYGKAAAERISKRIKAAESERNWSVQPKSGEPAAGVRAGRGPTSGSEAGGVVRREPQTDAAPELRPGGTSSPRLDSESGGDGVSDDSAKPDFSLSRKLTTPDEDEGKVNYSGLGALEDATVRNLSQLRRANTEAWEAAVRSAASKSEASVIVRTAVPKIEQALAGKISFENFRRALIESRLQGLEQRWRDMGDFALRASDANLAKSGERLVPLMEHIEDREGFSRNLGQTAASLYQKKDFPSLRALLADTFQKASEAVTHIMEPSEFQSMTSQPEFRRALTVYKNLMEAPMAESHETNEGVFSDALGPLNTYYPLVPVQDEDKKRLRTASKQEYSRPKNILNHFATGLSDDYDASMEAFRDRMTRAVKANNKAAFMDALVENRLVVPLKPFERAGDLIRYRGQEYQAVRMETTPARVIVQDGKVTHLPANSVLVPKWLHKELEPILQNKYSKPTLSLIHKIIQKANEVAISGPADFVWHSSNLFGTLVANTPFLSDSVLGKAASIPVMKRFAAIAKVLAVDPTTEESAAELQEMAKLGMLPDKFAGETYSRTFAEQTGAKLRRFTAGPMLYGPKGIDVRARLVMFRLAKQINPDASGPQLHLFVNQLGNYVDALQSQMERGAKHVGMSPFATAGTTMLRNGINAWTGAGPMPKDSVGLRIWQMLTGGALGTLALWILVHKAYTGKYPWEDSRSKLLQIPVNAADRKSKLGQALWGKGAETGYLNFSFFNPLVGRGARALGVKGAYDEAVEGGKWWQDFEAAQRDVMNSAAHPFLGPIPRAAFVGLTGDEPYVTSLRDDRARLNPQLMPAVRKAGEGSSVAKRAGAAAKELNSFFGNVAANSGLGESNAHDTTNRWERMVFDLALPGLVANGQNPQAQRARVLREAAAARRQSLAK